MTGWIAAHVVALGESTSYTFTIPAMAAGCNGLDNEFDTALFNYRFVDQNLSHYAASLDSFAGNSAGWIPTGSITAPSNSKVLAIFAGSGHETTNPPPYDECGSGCYIFPPSGSPALTLDTTLWTALWPIPI